MKRKGLLFNIEPPNVAFNSRAISPTAQHDVNPDWSYTQLFGDINLLQARAIQYIYKVGPFFAVLFKFNFFNFHVYILTLLFFIVNNKNILFA